MIPGVPSVPKQGGGPPPPGGGQGGGQGSGPSHHPSVQQQTSGQTGSPENKGTVKPSFSIRSLTKSAKMALKRVMPTKVSFGKC